MRRISVFTAAAVLAVLLWTVASGMYFESISGKGGMSFRVCPQTAAGINLTAIDDLFVRAMDKKSGDVYIQGDPKAQYELGVLFYTMYNATQHESVEEDKEAQSYGRAFNLTQAAYWLNRAANEDYAPAQFLLYYIQLWCMGEHGTAYVWLDKAVQNGYSKAQAMRANILLNNAMPYSRTKDKAKKKESADMFKSAFDLASKSAAQGDAFGMYVLYRIHNDKTCPMYNEAQAEKWLRKAQNAARNDPDITISIRD